MKIPSNMDKGGKASAKPKTKVKKETNDRSVLPPHLQNNNYNDVLIIGAYCDRSDVNEFRSTVSQIVGNDVVIDVLLLTEKHCQDEDGAIKRSTLAMFYFTQNTTQIYVLISGDKNFIDLLYGQKIIPVYSMRKEELNLPMTANVAAPLMYYRRDPEFKRAVQTLIKKHQHIRPQRVCNHEEEERQFLKETEKEHPRKTQHREQPIIYIRRATNVQIGDQNVVVNKNHESDSEKESFSNEDLNIRNGDFVDMSLPVYTQGRRDGNENDERHLSTHLRQISLDLNPENNICHEINSNTFLGASNIPFESNIQSKPSQDGLVTSSTSRSDSFSSMEQISRLTSRGNVRSNTFTSSSNISALKGKEGSSKKFKPTDNSEDIHSNERGNNIDCENNIPPRDTLHISGSGQPLGMNSSLPAPQPINWTVPSCDNISVPDDCENNTASLRSSSHINSLPKATPIPDLSPFTSLFSSNTSSSNFSTPPSLDGESPASLRSSSEPNSLPKATPIHDLSPFTSLFSSSTHSSNVRAPPTLDGESPNILYGSSLSLPLHQSPSLNDSLMTENHSKKKENHSKKKENHSKK